VAGSARTPVRWPGRLLGCLAVLNSVGALAGAVGLATGFLALGPSLDARLPWQSPVVAGVALGLLVALPNGALATVALRRGRGTGPFGIAVGTAMVVWILVELAFIRQLSFLHPLYVAVGLVMVWSGVRAVRIDLGVTATSLVQELRDVVADVPRFLTAPLVRRRHLRWGATDEEVAAPVLGDGRLTHPDYVSTRAVTIAAPPETVWPWLVQVGRGRAGFYSDDLLDNGTIPSAQRIDERWQHVELGQWVPMAEKITPRTAFRVAEVRAPYELLWRKPDSTWAWTLTRTEEGGTRLVTRIRAVHDRQRWTRWLLSVLLLEVGDYPMQRRMLLHLRDRAERPSAPVDVPAGRPPHAAPDHG
jgi:hypothetical protein